MSLGFASFGRRYGCLLLCLSGAIVIAGCGSKGNDKRAAVKGKVTLDGEPIKKGRINFTPAAGSEGPATGSVIIDGSYDIPAEQGAAVGKNNVEIRSAQDTGKKVKNPYGGEDIPESLEAVPDKYNLKTELTADIAKGKVNEANFDLTGNKFKKKK